MLCLASRARQCSGSGAIGNPSIPAKTFRLDVVSRANPMIPEYNLRPSTATPGLPGFCQLTAGAHGPLKTPSICRGVWQATHDSAWALVQSVWRQNRAGVGEQEILANKQDRLFKERKVRCVHQKYFDFFHLLTARGKDRSMAHFMCTWKPSLTVGSFFIGCRRGGLQSGQIMQEAGMQKGNSGKHEEITTWIFQNRIPPCGNYVKFTNINLSGQKGLS